MVRQNSIAALEDFRDDIIIILIARVYLADDIILKLELNKFNGEHFSFVRDVIVQYVIGEVANLPKIYKSIYTCSMYLDLFYNSD